MFFSCKKDRKKSDYDLATTIASCGEVIITKPLLLSGGFVYEKLYIYFETVSIFTSTEII